MQGYSPGDLALLQAQVTALQAQVITLQGQVAALQAPVPGQLLRAPAIYAPAVATPFTTSSAVLSAVSSANIRTGGFTAPSSGQVVITASLVASSTSSGPVYGFGLAAHGSTSPLACPAITQTDTGAASALQPLVFRVAGLTPGLSYDFDLLYCVAGGKNLTVTALGSTSTSPAGVIGAPVVMLVQAA